jgi:hypothetical protein
MQVVLIILNAKQSKVLVVSIINVTVIVASKDIFLHIF